MCCSSIRGEYFISGSVEPKHLKNGMGRVALSRRWDTALVEIVIFASQGKTCREAGMKDCSSATEGSNE